MIQRVGTAVSMAALTTFLSGFAIIGVQVEAFLKLAIFLMLIMALSWVYAIFYFLPLLASIDQGTNMFRKWYHSKISQESDENTKRETDMTQNEASAVGPFYLASRKSSIAEFIPDF